MVVSILGTPKGQARAQLPQPMQRSGMAERTTPAASILMASAGQTAAHDGSVQCMQTVGAVCTEAERSTKSRWIIDFPPWLGHSLHASTQARQPMQRLASTKSS